jgi:uncharacterized protein YecT (DUF1311 family)
MEYPIAGAAVGQYYVESYMHKYGLLAALSCFSFSALAASPEAVSAALGSLNQTNSALLSSQPEVQRPAMELVQNQWIAWSQLDCKAANGLPLEQQYSMNTEPFGSCMLDQIKRRTEQMQARMPQ